MNPKSSFKPQYRTRIIGFLRRFTENIGLKSVSNMYIFTIQYIHLYCNQKIILNSQSLQMSWPGRALDKCPGRAGRPGSLWVTSRGARPRDPASPGVRGHAIPGSPLCQCLAACARDPRPIEVFFFLPLRAPRRLHPCVRAFINARGGASESGTARARPSTVTRRRCDGMTRIKRTNLQGRWPPPPGGFGASAP